MFLPDFHESLFVPGDRILVAVSGGPDSLSLLHQLWSECSARGYAAVEAAHLDHGLRGSESAAEAAWVAAWCAERAISCHLGLADVKALARKGKASKQQAARTARYDFLEEVATQIQATAIATAHTQDDQVETVLMNILRGTGLDGLRGIPLRRGLFVRPMLGVSRAEIEAYCVRYHLEPRRDPSNLSSDAYTRNRVRLELLPQMAREYNPNISHALLRLSEIARRDEDFLHLQAEAALETMLLEQDANHLALDRPALGALHPALVRYVLRLALAELRGTGEGLAYEHLEKISEAALDEATTLFSQDLPAPACTVRVTSRTVILTLPSAQVTCAEVTASLPIPGVALMPQTKWQVRAGFAPLPDASFTATLDADSVQGSVLTLRNWRHGDRLDPLGMGGRHKKVSDIFADAKVPLAERTRVPIIADEVGILWIVGHCISERAKVTPETQRRLYLAAGSTTHPASV